MIPFSKFSPLVWRFLVQNMSAISIVFPNMLLCILASLFYLSRFFEGWEFLLLDGDELEIKEWVGKKRGAMDSLRSADFEDTERGDQPLVERTENVADEEVDA